MSKQILARELHLIRERLEAIERALGEQMTPEDKKALEKLSTSIERAKQSDSCPLDQGIVRAVEGSPIAKGGKRTGKVAERGKAKS